MQICPHLDLVLNLAELEGNSIASISKSEFMDKIVWMNNKISTGFKEKVLVENNLGYEKFPDVPHDPSTEDFICWKCKAVLVFPT